MEQYEEEKPNQPSLIVKPERKSKTQINSTEPGLGPGQSCVSFRSNRSMDKPTMFKSETSAAVRRSIQNQEPEPEVSCVSSMSDRSMDKPTMFHSERLAIKKIYRSHGPDPSCLSFKSDRSMDKPTMFKSQHPAVKRLDQKHLPDPSSVSFRSNQSKEQPLKFKSKLSTLKRFYQNSEPDPSCVSLKSNRSMDKPTMFNTEQLSKRMKIEISEFHSAHSAQQYDSHVDSIFMVLEENIITFVKKELKKMQKFLSTDYPECSLFEDEDDEQRNSREAFVKITNIFLGKMKQEKLAERLQNYSFLTVCRRKHKSALKKKFQHLFEGIPKEGKPALLNQIYTQLYITEGWTAEVNYEHEIIQMEKSLWRSDKAVKAVRSEDIFKLKPESDQPIRTVMTKGVAGIGKTVLTQRFILDWAEDKANQDIQFLFPFTFRKLNVLKERKFSLVELIHHFFIDIREAGLCNFNDVQVVFIFNDLDECQLPLDFYHNEIITDVTESTSLDVLLTNLISGHLFPSARLWITTRPAAAKRIPAKYVNMMTEVRGFTERNKEKYFMKRFRDGKQANKILSHIKTTHSLYIMCHIPVFCWITATVLGEVLEARKSEELPSTLTEMYIHFLLFQTKLKRVKYDGGSNEDSHWSPENRKMIEDLGKLAFEQLQKGNSIFYESDLKECGIDITEASVYSGVFTQIFKEEKGMQQEKMFRFVHLSVQEFLAALHVHQTFIKIKVNLMEESAEHSETYDLQSLHQWTVFHTLQSPNGHLDLFLRFLLGLSLPSSQKLLQGLIAQTESSSQSNQDTLNYIRRKLDEDLSTERSINLFHCLKELNDPSVKKEIQRIQSSDKLSPPQWSALAFILLSSENYVDVFDLKNFSSSEEVLLRLLPVVKVSRKAILSICTLSDEGCLALSAVLGSQSSRLTELELRTSTSGVRKLSDGLQSPNCKLEALRLKISEPLNKSCAVLSSVLSTQSTCLKKLFLSHNSLQDSRLKHLSDGLKSPNCKLETLWLNVCELSEKSCDALSAVLSCQSCSLTELDLSNNDLWDSGLIDLCDGLTSSNCKLETLSLSGCQLTEDGCTFLATALKSNSSHMKKLDVSYNHPGDSAVEQLMDVLMDPQKLRFEPTGEKWLIPGLRKYSCELSINTNTVNNNLKLSNNNRKVTLVEENQTYPDHPDRFNWTQMLCENILTGRCYWEVEWRGNVCISVSYKEIKRRGKTNDCVFGRNDQSWSLNCSDQGFSVCHNNRVTHISSSSSNRVAVYVDCPAGTLSFYKVSSESLIHLHTFNTTFTQPLLPGFLFGVFGSSVDLC